MTSTSQICLGFMTLLFAMIALLGYKKSLPQPLRPLHVVMPFVALVYCIILLLVQSFLVPVIKDALTGLSTSSSFVQGLVTGSIDIVSAWVFALAALVLFVIIKCLILYVFTGIEKSLPNTLLNRFKGLFSFAYEWNDYGGMWSIKDEYRALGTLSKWLYFVVLIVSCLLLFLYPSTIALYSPCYGLIIFGEIARFLQSPPCTDVKPTGSMDYQDGSTSVANYDRLTEAYQGYENRIVCVDKETGRSYRKTMNHNIVAPLLESESLEDNLAGQYLKSLQLMGEDLDDDKAYMLQRLLHGENVVCASPFYWDFGRYILFPLVRTLSHGNKAMVLCGSDIRIEDVKAWLEKEIGFVSGVEELWRIGLLFDSENDDNIDICVMNVNDANRQNELMGHSDFLASTRFVLLLNPSTSFSSAQVGLGLFARSLGGGHQVTYCICDKNTNGLVDSLSHALRANFVEVESPHAPEGTVCSVIWKAEDPEGVSMHHQLYGEIAQYLGLGTEISSIAAKYGISNITWTGQSNVPLQDMRWIAQQYYRKICAYADLDASAAALDDHIAYKNGMWDSKSEDHAFYVVEDEGANAFEVLRRFSSRGTEDAFINVISPNYLLRDYMSDNSRLFLADPKAIPHVIPDYANTLRNTALSLFARLSCGPVLKEEVEKTLILAGAWPSREKKSSVEILVEWAENYLYPSGETQDMSGSISTERMLVGIDPETLCYNYEDFVRLSRGHKIEEMCKSILAQSFYICEDEELNKNVLGSCLTGHIFQTVLPGQGIVLDGKYYEVLSLDLDCVLLRRAADHFNKRLQYRQIKKVSFENWTPNDRLNRTRQFSNLKLELAEACISVSTEGYLEMKDLSDFESARFVRMDSIPDRNYRNKTALKISFEEAHAKPEVIATITVLLEGLFRTIYNENAKFLMIGSLCAQESDFPKGAYTEIQSEHIDENAIYILEDSNIDLGLIDSIDRNIVKLLGIIEDYLSWHADRLEREYVEEAEGEEEEELALEIPEEILDMVVTTRRRSLFQRIKDFFSGFSRKKDKPDLGIVEESGKKKKKKKGENEGTEGDSSDVKTAEHDSEAASEPELPTESAQTPEEPEESESGLNSLASVQLFRRRALASTVVSPDEADEASQDQPIENDRYKRENFLMFGRSTYPSSLAVKETIDFLNGLGIHSADLHQARKDLGEKKTDEIILPESAHYCDFCGEPILSLEYDILDDGRERCVRCTREAIGSLDEFERVYAEVKKTMCQLYHISLPAAVKVTMTTADEIAKKTGSNFVATDGFDARAVGVAIKKGRGNYVLFVESGAPRISVIGTLAHELTHIWQYENWSESAIKSNYGSGNALAVYEGMAVWSEVQYLFATNNRTIAIKRLMNEIQREDVYGAGLRSYYKKYGLTTRTCSSITKDHPFKHGERPL